MVDKKDIQDGQLQVTPSFNLYANYCKGFETPTFIEATYNSVNAGATSNLNLKPSESRNFELGAKAIIAGNTQVNLNLFRITTKNEIVIRETNPANRSVYANANDTKRAGVDFTGVLGLVASGNKIPGTYKTQLYGKVA